MFTAEKNAAFVLGAALLIGGCGGGGGSNDSAAVETAPAQAPITSSASSSGSTAVFVKEGVSHAVTPGASASAGGVVNLVRLPNSGSLVAALTETQVSTTPITVSLQEVSGTAIDASHDIGLAYNYKEGQVSFFSVSTRTETATYDTATSHELQFSGGGGKIVGAVMNPATQTAILATADGFEIVDYRNPSAPVKTREIPSLAINRTDGIEINENFAFHPALTVAGTTVDLILSGGRYDEAGLFPNDISLGNSLEFADANTGTVYRPDASTGALFVHASYVDAISVDMNYHVAVLAPEYSSEKVLVDLNQLQLDAASKTFSLPATAVAVIDTGAGTFKFTNIAIESANHLVMMGEGYNGEKLLVAELANPSVKLGFNAITSQPIPMPSSADNTGAAVHWAGSGDPHGAGAYVTATDHPTKPSTSIGLWASGDGQHIAVIDLRRVLDGQQVSGTSYDPTGGTPADISYIKVSEQTKSDTTTGGRVTANGGTLAFTGQVPTGFASPIEFVTAVTDPSPDGTNYAWLSEVDPTTDSAVAIILNTTNGGVTESVSIIFYDQIGVSTTSIAFAGFFSADCAAVTCPVVDTSNKTVSFDDLPLTADALLAARQTTGTITLSGSLSY